ncbi:hypothetical protein K0U73_19845, partial [bacterium]|nr:hypothetical protein [bacterium]
MAAVNFIAPEPTATMVPEATATPAPVSLPGNPSPDRPAYGPEPTPTGIPSQTPTVPPLPTQALVIIGVESTVLVRRCCGA